MDERLKQLVFQVQQYPHESEERQDALIKLVAQMLRSRQICRPSNEQPLSGIYLKIFQDVQRQLIHDVGQVIDSYNSQRIPIRAWASSLRDSAFKKVLDNSHLTSLALEVQRHKPRSQEWQYGLRELLNAIQLSGKLLQQNQFTAEVYEDAVAKTWIWICQNINTYNPQKGKFTAWVNYRLDVILREIKQEYKDPFIQSLEGQVIRKKYQLTALIIRTKEVDFKSWLTLKLKRVILDSPLNLQIFNLLTVLFLLSELIKKDPHRGNSLLFELAKEFILLPYEITEESRILENFAQPKEKPFLSETVRQYIEDDSVKLFKKHIREHPQVTFQAIALARLDGRTWKELSESFGIKMSTLNNFFERCLREFAPKIRTYVHEQFD